MSRIIAGRFDKTVDADAALEALRREGFTREELDSFYVSPPGQHAMAPLGGDAPFASAGSRFAGAGAAMGALLGGLAGTLIAWLVARDYGARDLGRAEGVWRNGWKDFDPRSPLMTP